MLFWSQRNLFRTRLIVASVREARSHVRMDKEILRSGEESRGKKETENNKPRSESRIPNRMARRLFLHFKGISGAKRVGLQQLEIAAARGRYPRRFAKIPLALAALREKKTEVARVHLIDLVSRSSRRIRSMSAS